MIKFQDLIKDFMEKTAKELGYNNLFEAITDPNSMLAKLKAEKGESNGKENKESSKEENKKD